MSRFSEIVENSAIPIFYLSNSTLLRMEQNAESPGSNECGGKFITFIADFRIR